MTLLRFQGRGGGIKQEATTYGLTVASTRRTAGAGSRGVPSNRGRRGRRANGEPHGSLWPSDELAVAGHVSVRYEPVRALVGAPEDTEDLPNASGLGGADIIFYAFAEGAVRGRCSSQGGVRGKQFIIILLICYYTSWGGGGLEWREKM